MTRGRMEQGGSRVPAGWRSTVLTALGLTVVIAAALLAVFLAWPGDSRGDPTIQAGAPDLRPMGANDEPIAPIPPPPVASPLKLRLGERLFQDPRLSRGNVRSCSTCHDIKGNGASTAVFDKAVDGAPMYFNTSTVFNAALSFRFGWEGRTDTLQHHADCLIRGPAMGSSPEEAAAKLQSDPQIDRQFRAAYGHSPDAASVTDALSTFERSLVTPGSRFDRWLNGDTAALSAQELDGYHLFKSLGCIACHQGVNVGGNLFERHGIFHPLARRDPVILRVPSLRNIAATPPYFHDGSARTLQAAVQQMASAQLDDSLTDAQTDEIVAFLRTLSGRYQGRLIGATPPAAQAAGADEQALQRTSQPSSAPLPRR